MKYIITIFLIAIVIAGVYNIPKPQIAEGEKVDEIQLEVKVYREYEERTIEDEIKFVFGDNWKLAYAVMMSESRGKATAQNVNTSGSTDFGYWQINDYYHSHVTQECAESVSCSTAYAYKLSKGGIDFSAWYGYLHGGYRKFL